LPFAEKSLYGKVDCRESSPVGEAEAGRQRQLYGYGISAKRYGLYQRDDSGFRLIKVSEHGLEFYYRPTEGRDSECEVPMWIKEGWEWMLSHALGLPCQEPDWFHLPVMRRIAISTPNVMAALRHLRRDQARPYNRWVRQGCIFRPVLLQPS